MLCVIVFLTITMYLILKFFQDRKPGIILENQYLTDMKPVSIKTNQFQMVISINSLEREHIYFTPVNSEFLQNDFKYNIEGGNYYGLENIGEFINCDKNNSSTEIMKELNNIYPHSNDRNMICLHTNVSELLLGGNILGSKRITAIDSSIDIDLCQLERIVQRSFFMISTICTLFTFLINSLMFHNP